VGKWAFRCLTRANFMRFPCLFPMTDKNPSENGRRIRFLASASLEPGCRRLVRNRPTSYNRP
jgi:hypothetical protein